MIRIITGLLIFALFAMPVLGKPVYKRITFKKGARLAIVAGRLGGYNQTLYYVIRLRAGQRLEISGDRYITLGGVLDPKGRDVMDYAANCNGRADSSPTISGDYKIAVSECNKADPWRGTFHLRIKVT